MKRKALVNTHYGHVNPSAVLETHSVRGAVGQQLRRHVVGRAARHAPALGQPRARTEVAQLYMAASVYDLFMLYFGYVL